MALNYVVNHSTLKTNLVSWWPLNEASTGAGAVTRYDAHGSNDLTDNNTTASATGQWNRGADFEKSNSEYLSGSHISSVKGTGAMSISMWIKAEDLSGSTSFVLIAQEDGSSNGWKLRVNHTTKVLHFMTNESGSGQVIGGTALSAATWYHVVVTMDGSGNQAVYLNGVDDSNTTTAGLATTNTADLNIARSPLRTTRLFDGIIQDVGIWDKELSSAEIADLYNSGDGMTYGVDYWSSAIGSLSNPATSATATVEIGGTNPVVFAMTGVPTSDKLTSVTYNSQTMTQIGTIQLGDTRYCYLYYLDPSLNPTAGSYTLQVNGTSDAWVIGGICLVGVDQTSPYDVTVQDRGTGASLYSDTITTTVDHTWVVGGARAGTSISTYNDTTVLHSVSGLSIFYDKTAVSAGALSVEMDITGAGNADLGWILAAAQPVQPAAASTFTPKVMFF